MKRHKYTLTLLGAAAGVSMAIAGTGVASAATSSHQPAFSRAAGAAAKLPNSNITGAGKKAVYKPATLRVTWSGPSEQRCTAAKFAFTITNTTKVTQTVTLGGKTFATVKPGRVDGVCAWGTGSTTGVFVLKSDGAKLTVHVS
jgi:hypothetical protein